MGDTLLVIGLCLTDTDSEPQQRAKGATSEELLETHMSSVLRKLELSSRHGLTRWASDRRLL